MLGNRFPAGLYSIQSILPSFTFCVFLQFNTCFSPSHGIMINRSEKHHLKVPGICSRLESNLYQTSLQPVGDPRHLVKTSHFRHIASDVAARCTMFSKFIRFLYFRILLLHKQDREHEITCYQYRSKLLHLASDDPTYHHSHVHILPNSCAET